jgi:hypothetical protein
MFSNSPFESITKTMKENAEKFNPAASQEAFKPVMEQFKAWGELAQKQAQVGQAALTESFESFKNIKEPQAAFEAMKTSTENAMTMATKNLKEVTALGFEQFHTSVDAVQKAHPAPEAFASVSKGMKSAASSMETAMDSAMKTGTTAVKKSRAA